MNSHHASVLFISDINSYTLTKKDTEESVNFLFEKLGIDEVRMLTEEAHRRPAESFTTKCIFVRSQFVTLEAQHALLKILEEPPQNCRFFLVFPKGMTLLPTVLSRVSLITTEEKNVITEDFLEFTAADYATRLSKIEAELKNKNTTWQQSIKAGLVTYLETTTMHSAGLLADVDFVAQNLLTRGASNKFLLEQLALALPLK